MNSRRDFLAQTGLFSLGTALSINLDKNMPKDISPSDKQISWKKIRKCFPISKHKYANFNNGSAGVMPSPVLKKHIEWTTQMNSFAPYEMQIGWADQASAILHRLAGHMGISSGQFSVVRNTTEAINMILWGIPFRENDEVIYADWDYPYVEFTLKHISKEKNVTLKNINSTLINLSDEDIVKFYKNKITRRTRLMIITWITHREGRILPVKEIKQLADEHGIEVLIDGAHVPGQIQHNISQIDPDYFATSLHKWLNGPIGTGLLYIKDSKINALKPPISYPPNKKNNFIKFEYLGTKSFQNIMTVDEALNFLELTGIERKEKRLKELSDYWIDQVKNIPDLKVISPADSYCAINSFTVKNLSVFNLKVWLKNNRNIHVKTSSYAKQKIHVVRVSPNIYSTFEELDRMIDGIKTYLK